MEDILAHKSKVKKIIVNELNDIAKKYGQPRKTEVIFAIDVAFDEKEEEEPDFPINLFFTKEGYFKKITPQALRTSGEQKLKEGDSMLLELEATNNTELLFFTDKCQVYKSRVSDFAECKASVLGHFIPSVLGFENGENCLFMAVTNDYKGFILIFFKNV